MTPRGITLTDGSVLINGGMNAAQEMVTLVHEQIHAGEVAGGPQMQHRAVSEAAVNFILGAVANPSAARMLSELFATAAGSQRKEGKGHHMDSSQHFPIEDVILTAMKSGCHVPAAIAIGGEVRKPTYKVISEPPLQLARDMVGTLAGTYPWDARVRGNTLATNSVEVTLDAPIAQSATSRAAFVGQPLAGIEVIVTAPPVDGAFPEFTISFSQAADSQGNSLANNCRVQPGKTRIVNVMMLFGYDYEKMIRYEPVSLWPAAAPTITPKQSLVVAVSNLPQNTEVEVYGFVAGHPSVDGLRTFLDRYDRNAAEEISAMKRALSLSGVGAAARAGCGCSAAEDGKDAFAAALLSRLTGRG